MKFKETGFKDLIIISNEYFSDERGVFKESYRKNLLQKKISYKIEFCQENFVESFSNVLRGLHFQKEPYSQSKLISVFEGEILDIAVDIRKNSKTYGKYFSYVLSSKKNESLFIPKGFAHGYLTLSKKAYINYKVDNYYNKSYEDGISYNDRYLNIDWNTNYKSLIISEKDKKLKNYIW